MTSKYEKELEYLKSIALDCGLTEETKWGQPCFTWHEKNIVILGELKKYCVISFFKGALLSDDQKILVQVGKVQSDRLIPFTKLSEIVKMERIVKSYIYEAIEIEKAGLKVRLKETSEYPMPEELKKKLANNATFRKAFNGLTPGRQRGYIIHFSEPKKPETREGRIEKCTPKIMKGEGLHDDYKK